MVQEEENQRFKSFKLVHAMTALVFFHGASIFVFEYGHHLLILHNSVSRIVCQTCLSLVARIMLLHVLIIVSRQ